MWNSKDVDIATITLRLNKIYAFYQNDYHAYMYSNTPSFQNIPGPLTHAMATT